MTQTLMAQMLLDRLTAQGVQVTRLENDSRRVQPGDVFVAYPGHGADGRKFIPMALERGAVAVLWEARDFTWPTDWTVPQVGVEGLQSFAGHLAHLVYGRPSEQLKLVGLTGTNGKTSCSQWIAQALDGAGQPCAVIGTLGNGLLNRGLDASANTTPDALALHRLLADYLTQGARACAAEISSIGLDQGRCNGARFAVAVFTNLTRDHLDYHGTMEAYGAAKARLFSWPELNEAVINLDDPFGRHLITQTTAGLRIGYTREGRQAPEADWLLEARDLTHTPEGMAFTLVAPGGAVAVRTALVGGYNVSNLLAVAGTLLALGLPLDQVGERLSALLPPPGRMQRLGGRDEPLVVVDYSHTPDALENALTALREVAMARGGQLHCVFGCGGDRDHGKRPQMGAIAQRLADQVLLTNDNPRNEDPLAILADIRAGAPEAPVEPERARAVEQTVINAAAPDVVLVAGKGHEPYQEIKGVRLPYSDVTTAERALGLRREKEA